MTISGDIESSLGNCSIQAVGACSIQLGLDSSADDLRHSSDELSAHAAYKAQGSRFDAIRDRIRLKQAAAIMKAQAERAHSTQHEGNC